MTLKAKMRDMVKYSFRKMLKILSTTVKKIFSCGEDFQDLLLETCKYEIQYY